MNKINEVKPSKKIRGIIFYTVDDLVKILGLTKLTVRKYLYTGKIEGAIKVGKRYYVSSRNLDRWLNKGSVFSRPDKYILKLIEETVKRVQQENYELMKRKIKEELKKEMEQKYELSRLQK